MEFLFGCFLIRKILRIRSRIFWYSWRGNGRIIHWFDNKERVWTLFSKSTTIIVLSMKETKPNQFERFLGRFTRVYISLQNSIVDRITPIVRTVDTLAVVVVGSAGKNSPVIIRVFAGKGCLTTIIENFGVVKSTARVGWLLILQDDQQYLSTFLKWRRRQVLLDRRYW